MKLAKIISLLLVVFISLSSITVAQDCSNFCVWPGDANNNGIANHFDVLQLGKASSSTGPFRTNVDTDWSAKEANQWPETFVANNANFKHADANGDGFVDLFDIYPIGNNFGETNALFTGAAEGNNILGTDLTASLSQTIYSDGETVTITISLGTAAEPVSDLMGLAFSLVIDTQYVQQVIEPVTWNFGLIGPEEDLFLFDKWEPGISDAVHFAFARNNGIPINGYGDILTVELVIIDDLSLRYSETQPYEVDIRDVLGIDSLENDLLITSNGDAASLLVTTSTEEWIDNDLSIYPNPFSDKIWIEKINDIQLETVEIYDVYGKLVHQEPAFKEEINLSHLTTGIYYLSIKTDKGKYFKKIVKPK